MAATQPLAISPSKPKWMQDTVVPPHKAFFGRCQDARVQRHLGAVPEDPPPSWASWFTDALAAVGGNEERLFAAWLAWLEDEWGQGRKPICPARAFIGPEVWRRHVPGQGNGVARAEQSRGSRGVGANETPEAQPLPDSPAGHVWGQVLEAARSARPYQAAFLAAWVTPVALDGGVLAVRCQDRFNATWFDDERRGWLSAYAKQLGIDDFRVTAPGLDSQGVAS